MIAIGDFQDVFGEIFTKLDVLLGVAVGGSGDVLSGVIVGLLAQGIAPYEAACLGAYLHASAAAQYAYPSGLLMSELCDLLPQTMAQFRED